ncbi:MAG: F0F1 ATP synthase subunit epsilon [Frankiaceae bacterium]|jgi:F-type H+-transporting ATPase subunit epsilon|nr:F0F1 ATP synthase subunit epsilon [Frankiaceae bacterium]
MSTMQVELVAVERPVWSGQATLVAARAAEGEIGIMPGHEPLLAVLQPGWIVRIAPESGSELRFAVHGGFISVRDGAVSVLAEGAEAAQELDEATARADLAAAEAQIQAAGAQGSADAYEARDRALAQLRALDVSVPGGSAGI